MALLLECKTLAKRYGEVAALDGIDLSLEAGKVIGLLGPNGSGKTTLIKLANGLIKPTSGQVLIEGMAPCVKTKAKVAYLPDRDFLPEYMSTAQLLDYYEDFFADFDRERALGMLADLGLDASGRLKELSRGTREKVQLILTMSRRAHAYLLDEPIAGVDPAARDYICARSSPITRQTRSCSSQRTSSPTSKVCSTTSSSSSRVMWCFTSLPKTCASAPARA